MNAVTDTPPSTGTDYRHPYRPRLVRVGNAVGRLLRRAGADVSLDETSLLTAARKSTGLTHFGDESFRTPLKVLLESIEAEARLTPLGRVVTRQRLVGVLANRLRVEALVTAHPEIRAIPVEDPIVIAGVQRTGTTMLHRLLAADPGLRALHSWEALAPAPLRAGRVDRALSRLGFDRADPRVLQARAGEKGLAYLAPDFFAIHPVEAEAPEEDVLLLDHAFLSTVPEATLRVPTYARWLEAQDATPAYEYLRLLLQVLSWQRAGERWVLKTPHHLEFLDTLLAIFPGARIIQTHRDPAETMASFCSMVAHGRGVFSDAIDPIEIGQDWLRKVKRMTDRARAARERHPAHTFYDVAYPTLVADPLAEIRRIYAWLDRPLTHDATRAMDAKRRKNVQHKHGRHVYRLEDFGLDAATVRATLTAA